MEPSPHPPLEYWGTRAICARLHVVPSTLYRWHRLQAFPLLMRGITRSSPLGSLTERRVGKRVVFTTEAMAAAAARG